MESKDLFELIYGLIWAAGLIMLWIRNKSKPNLWPRIFGVGGGACIFILLMTENIMRGPKSEILQDTIANLLLSLVFGVVCYFSGRELARRFGK
jgi:hypothetical protein